MPDDLGPAAGPIDAHAVERYRETVVAGHRGDVATATASLADPVGHVRAVALSALARLGAVDHQMLTEAMSDADPTVRARAVELAISRPEIPIQVLLTDPEDQVVETTCFSCGERVWASDAPVEQLGVVATSHANALCREAAAAALGAIGDPRGLDAVLEACRDRVTVRRRAVLALAAFDDPRAEAALEAALTDKDWQVRQAAEDLLGVGRVLDAPPDDDAYAE